MAATQELVRYFFPEIEVAIGENEAAGIRKKPAPDTVVEALRQLGVGKEFFPEIEVAIGENEAAGIRKKPAPDTVVEALRQLSVGKEGAVYVGDSDVDVATACNSGLPCISVLWGFRDRDFLLQHGATTFINHPRELLE